MFIAESSDQFTQAMGSMLSGIMGNLANQSTGICQYLPVSIVGRYFFPQSFKYVYTAWIKEVQL